MFMQEAARLLWSDDVADKRKRRRRREHFCGERERGRKDRLSGRFSQCHVSNDSFDRMDCSSKRSTGVAGDWELLMDTMYR